MRAGVPSAVQGAPEERVRASFGAPPLSEPLNPPASEAGLRPRPVLDRPGLEALSA